jgi:hypothetical protein
MLKPKESYIPQRQQAIIRFVQQFQKSLARIGGLRRAEIAFPISL